MGKTAILAVDDDPQVLAAVSRDLRSRYGKDYRIVRAPSGAEALAALTDLQARGDTVAVLVADQRMPEMTGTEFLRGSQGLVPRRQDGPADRLRRHRGGHHRHQRHRARPLSAEAVGSAR